jgi:hypothetical protein
MKHTVLFSAVCVCLLADMVVSTTPLEDTPLSGTFVNWLKHPAIGYGTQTASDPIAELEKRIQAGQVILRYAEPSGYLRSLLDALNVPITSQIAVFLRDSLQAAHITPHNPRTIFFNDSIAVAWVRGGFIEIAAQDPRQAVVFYTVDRDRMGRPSFNRRDDCLTCHYNYSTSGVPGMVARSFGKYNVNHRIPLEQRWDGWYVTGRLGSIRHLGNLDTDDQYGSSQTADNLNWMSFDRKFDAAGYLSSQSDVVALMIFEHQMHMMNLLSRTGWEVRVAQYQKQIKGNQTADSVVDDDIPIPAEVAAKEVVDYMLFVEEPPIKSKIQGSTDFAKEFAAQGPKDRRGRSLRHLRLEGRLMQYPCSYMIYSSQFDNLPQEAKGAIYQRMWQILSGQETSSRYRHLSRTDRMAITDILRDTKKDLPTYFEAASVK